MAADPFIFLRATFYRWAQAWPEVCANLTDAPVVLAVGDLHIENFGTWRDSEGRLIWGVNDFDEAFPLPYTNDLVRLATSANLAIAANHLSLDLEDACDAILEGYRKGLVKKGCPFVLGEEHTALRKMAHGVLRDPEHFWMKVNEQAEKVSRQQVPGEAIAALMQLMPEKSMNFDLATRRAGQGSLGRQRFLGLSSWRGGKIAREAKALALSAWLWAHPSKNKKERIYYEDIMQSAVRCSDPYVSVQGNWVVRRLAPDCSRIDLATLPQERDEKLLLAAMGFELANVHLGTSGLAAATLRDLGERRRKWLVKAAEKMTDSIREDWKVWRARLADEE